MPLAIQGGHIYKVRIELKSGFESYVYDFRSDPDFSYYDQNDKEGWVEFYFEDDPYRVSEVNIYFDVITLSEACIESIQIITKD